MISCKDAIKHQEGSISFLLAFVLTAVLLLQSVVIRASRLRELELRAGRSIDLVNDSVLAQYDKTLADHYGLLAIKYADIPVEVARYINDDLSQFPAKAEISTVANHPLTEGSALKNQISDYMKLLYPQMMLNKILKQVEVLSSLAQEQASVESSVHSSKMLLQASNAPIQSILADPLIEASLHQLKDFILSQSGDTSQILRNFFSNATDRHEGDEPYVPDLNPDEQAAGDDVLKQISLFDGELEWDLSQIGGLLNQGIAFLDFDTNHLYDKLLVTEYILGMTANWSDQRTADELIDPRENMRGASIRSVPLARELETEFILAGIDGETGTKAAVGTMLIATRLAIRTIAMLSNESEMSKLNTWAAILSVGLMIVSGGSVAIDKTVLKYALVLIRAQIDAVIDLNDLLNGKTVDLIPYVDAVNISSVYSDYVRLFLLAGSDKNQLTRLAESINANLNGPFYTTIESSISFVSKYSDYESFTLKRSDSYQNHVERGDGSE